MEQITAHFIGNIPRDNDKLRKIAENLTRGHQYPASAEVAYDPDDSDGSAIAEETYTVEEISDNAIHYSGELSHWNFSRRVQREVNSLATDSGPHESFSDSGNYRAKYLQSSGPTVASVAQCFPPRPVAEFLASIFFRFAQTNYFFIEKDWFSVKLDAVYTQSLGWSSDESPTWCILFMVLGIGTQFVHLDSASTFEDSFDFNPSRNETVEDDVGSKLYKLAAKLVPDVLTIASLESVQACLLLGVYTLPLDTPGLSYTYLGVALRVCIQNGLHRRKPETLLDEHAIEVRKRLWWTVFTLERRICILHGRPLSISRSDMDIEMPIDLPLFRPANFENLRAIIMLTPHLESIASTL
ncbi:unnamed protein product [Clonostachys rosea]|uniref:Xylanolytic transcriptional activator regulatory domain-containing protein n=1 Tax=Bionectria ochroleuca TaxID=29856 RepID=A0ABY6UIJ0_BIOOC|nr:unnamed protein product [Clonostachys rosea]